MRRVLACNDAGGLPRSYDYASYSPEVVALLSVLASPYWQRIGGSGDAAEAFRFYRKVTGNGLTNGSANENTPLRSWIVKLREETRLAAVA